MEEIEKVTFGFLTSEVKPGGLVYSPARWSSFFAFNHTRFPVSHIGLMQGRHVLIRLPAKHLAYIEANLGVPYGAVISDFGQAIGLKYE